MTETESEASKQEREAWEAWQDALAMHREKRIRTTGLLRALDTWETASVEKVQAVQREGAALPPPDTKASHE